MLWSGPEIWNYFEWYLKTVITDKFNDDNYDYPRLNCIVGVGGVIRGNNQIIIFSFPGASLCHCVHCPVSPYSTPYILQLEPRPRNIKSRRATGVYCLFVWEATCYVDLDNLALQRSIFNDLLIGRKLIFNTICGVTECLELDNEQVSWHPQLSQLWLTG